LKRLASFPAIGLMLLLIGCALKKPVEVEVIIDGPACHAVTLLSGCDVSTSPPQRCKKSTTKYDHGCEQIKVK